MPLRVRANADRSYSHSEHVGIRSGLAEEEERRGDGRNGNQLTAADMRPISASDNRLGSVIPSVSQRMSLEGRGMAREMCVEIKEFPYRPRLVLLHSVLLMILLRHLLLLS